MALGLFFTFFVSFLAGLTEFFFVLRLYNYKSIVYYEEHILTLFFNVVLYLLSGKSQQIYFYFTDASVRVWQLRQGASRMDFDANLLNLRLADESSVTFDMSTVLYYRYFAETLQQWRN